MWKLILLPRKGLQTLCSPARGYAPAPRALVCSIWHSLSQLQQQNLWSVRLQMEWGQGLQRRGWLMSSEWHRHQTCSCLPKPAAPSNGTARPGAGRSAPQPLGPTTTGKGELPFSLNVGKCGVISMSRHTLSPQDGFLGKFNAGKNLFQFPF